VSTLLLAAVGGSGWQTGIALSADHLLAVVLGGKSLEGGFDDTATETEDEMKSRFL
jgi:ribose/xylose/arabinose/galactoside ABC-type transport system permease subunit